MTVGVHISILILLALALNIPFGAYRATTRRFSARWLLAVHLPIPMILVMRVASGYGYQVIPLLVAAAVAGQFLGSWAYTRWRTARDKARQGALVIPVAADEQPRERFSR